ncbi:hypothetical protein SAMN05518683_102121 [Salibacterium halotolerans]|uniref:Uncharacterized protein n=1 Tax=Salibacterium halotolerans TaxID=1884432 RepID=A0A1I5M6M2_9BACI|nr:hypothetical protein SAMN05518683_102121 [Salibacterium halotolerans]
MAGPAYVSELWMVEAQKRIHHGHHPGVPAPNVGGVRRFAAVIPNQEDDRYESVIQSGWYREAFSSLYRDGKVIFLPRVIRKKRHTTA